MHQISDITEIVHTLMFLYGSQIARFMSHRKNDFAKSKNLTNTIGKANGRASCY